MFVSLRQKLCQIIECTFYNNCDYEFNEKAIN